MLIALLVFTDQIRTEVAERSALTTSVRQVASDQIGVELERLLQDSVDWIFRGGSGRWLRGRTLQHLSIIRDREVPLGVQLLDPRDELLCAAYSRYRSRSRDPADVRPGEENPELIRTDILASIYATAWFAAQSRIVAEVVLLKSFSPLRLDVGTRGLFATVALRSAPGLFAQEQSWYYRSVLDEMRQAKSVNDVLELPDDNFPPRTGVDGAAVSRTLQDIRVLRPGGGSSQLLTGFADAPSLNFDEISQKALGPDGV